MIIIKSAEMLKNQITKARTIKPRVRFLSLRNYSVQSDTAPHIWHSVRFSYVNGERRADCSCAAGERNRACFHVASCISFHIQAMTEIRDGQRVAA